MLLCVREYSLSEVQAELTSEVRNVGHVTVNYMARRRHSLRSPLDKGIAFAVQKWMEKCEKYLIHIKISFTGFVSIYLLLDIIRE
jgi:hypothetical protein